MSEPPVAATSTPAPVQATDSVPSLEVTSAPARFDVPEVLVTAQASAINRRMILAGGACVMAIMALVALPGSSRVEAPSTTSPTIDSVAGRSRRAPAALAAQENVVVTPIEEQVVVRPVAQAWLTPAARVSSAAIVSSQPAAPETAGPAEPSHGNAPTIASAPTPKEPIAASPVLAHVAVKAEPVEQGAATPAVTITGCLEKRDDTFRLTDTDGDAPKSRSWKSGFLAKRPAAVELVDAASNLWLAAQVGQRVSATGTLDDHELHVRSVRRATGACN